MVRVSATACCPGERAHVLACLAANDTSIRCNTPSVSNRDAVTACSLMECCAGRVRCALRCASWRRASRSTRRPRCCRPTSKTSCRRCWRRCAALAPAPLLDLLGLSPLPAGVIPSCSLSPWRSTARCAHLRHTRPWLKQLMQLCAVMRSHCLAQVGAPRGRAASSAGSSRAPDAAPGS